MQSKIGTGVRPDKGGRRGWSVWGTPEEDRTRRVSGEPYRPGPRSGTPGPYPRHIWGKENFGTPTSPYTSARSGRPRRVEHVEGSPTVRTLTGSEVRDPFESGNEGDLLLRFHLRDPGRVTGTDRLAGRDPKSQEGPRICGYPVRRILPTPLCCQVRSYYGPPECLGSFRVPQSPGPETQVPQ